MVEVFFKCSTVVQHCKVGGSTWLLVVNFEGMKAGVNSLTSDRQTATVNFEWKW